MLRVRLTEGVTLVNADLVRSASFDREGRLLVASRGEATWRRGLSGGVYRRVVEGGRRWERLGEDEAQGVCEAAYGLAREARGVADGEGARRLEEEVAGWSVERLDADAQRFGEVYRPIPILPPDRYLSIVLQATEGCTWNGCTFCNFYMGRPFRFQSPEEFARHAQEVKALLGRGVLMRRGIFLADGNALALALPHLEPMVETARQEFPGHALYGFVDLYTGERRPPHQWQRLAELGLTRVYIGMETGLDELLAFVNKPGSSAELIDFVHQLKAAGVHASLIVMVGLGGHQYRQPHAEATVATLAQMPLGEGDLVYLSPFIEHPGSAYQLRRQAEGLTPMSQAEIAAEMETLAQRIRPLGVQVSRYDLREFIY